VSDSRAGARLRAAAAEVVDAVVRSGRSLDAALADAAARVADDDRPLLRLLASGALRHYWSLEARASALLDRPLRRRDSIVQALLLVGLVQLTDTRIPDHAAVSQTVEATRLLRRPQLAPLVNAILRRAIRDRNTAIPPSNEEAKYDHPAWLLDMLAKDWPDDWQDIVAANNDRAPMWLRVNALHGTAGDYVGELAAAGIEGAATLAALPQAVRLAEPVDVTALPGFADGRVSVQDAAAQLAAPWLLERVAGPVLDACAAPGGKAGHLLECGAGRIELTAVDSDAARLGRVGNTLDRLGLRATLVAADASNPKGWWDGRPYQAILLDAPCSATGVIRRHPDIRLLRRPSDVARLAAMQRAMLEALWPLLAPGGRLLYVTCSVLAAENEAVIGNFLAAEDAAEREEAVLQDYNIRDLMRPMACGYQVLPGVAGLDGFYYASLVKVS